MGFNTNVAVGLRCVSEDGTEEHEFRSMTAACNFLVEKHGVKLHHNMVRKRAATKEPYHGYIWTIQELAEKPADVKVPVEHDVTTSVFTFRECVENIFNGNNVRVTDEVPKRASVFDVIQVVLQVKNPRQTFNALCKEYADTCMAQIQPYQFPGSGERPTPVCDAGQLMKLINVLPGKRAAQFRNGAADVLVRYLAGDATMHAEIDKNAQIQAELPEAHPMKMMTEYTENNRPLVKACTFLSNKMVGLTIGHFSKRSVTYLIRFEFNGYLYVKVGQTTDLVDRMTAHMKELPGCQLYCAFIIDNPQIAEREFKERYRPYNVAQTVEGKVKTELYLGDTMEIWEQRLEEVCDEMNLKSAINRDAVEKKKAHEREMQLRQMNFDCEVALRKMEMEKEAKQAAIVERKLDVVEKLVGAFTSGKPEDVQATLAVLRTMFEP